MEVRIAPGRFEARRGMWRALVIVGRPLGRVWATGCGQRRSQRPRFTGRLRGPVVDADVVIAAGRFWPIAQTREVHDAMAATDGESVHLITHRKAPLGDAIDHQGPSRIRPSSTGGSAFDPKRPCLETTTCYDARSPALAEELTARDADAVLPSFPWMRDLLGGRHLGALASAQVGERGS